MIIINQKALTENLTSGLGSNIGIGCVKDNIGEYCIFLQFVLASKGIESEIDSHSVGSNFSFSNDVIKHDCAVLDIPDFWAWSDAR